MYVVDMQGNNYLKHYLGVFTSKKKAVDTLVAAGVRIYTAADAIKDLDKQIRRYYEWPHTHGTAEEHQEFIRRNVGRISASKTRIIADPKYARYLTTQAFQNYLIKNKLQAYSTGASFQEGLDIYIEKVEPNKIVNGFDDD